VANTAVKRRPAFVTGTGRELHADRRRSQRPVAGASDRCRRQTSRPTRRSNFTARYQLRRAPAVTLGDRQAAIVGRRDHENRHVQLFAGLEAGATLAVLHRQRRGPSSRVPVRSFTLSGDGPEGRAGASDRWRPANVSADASLNFHASIPWLRRRPIVLATDSGVAGDGINQNRPPSMSGAWRPAPPGNTAVNGGAFRHPGLERAFTIERRGARRPCWCIRTDVAGKPLGRRGRSTSRSIPARRAASRPRWRPTAGIVGDGITKIGRVQCRRSGSRRHLAVTTHVNGGGLRHGVPVRASRSRRRRARRPCWCIRPMSPAMCRPTPASSSPLDTVGGHTGPPLSQPIAALPATVSPMWAQ